MAGQCACPINDFPATSPVAGNPHWLADPPQIGTAPFERTDLASTPHVSGLRMIRAQPGKRPAIGPGSRKVSPNSFATGRIPRVRLPAMPSGGSKARLGEPTRSSRRTGGYSSVDSWIREMPKSKRRITWIGYLLQGYAIYCLWTRSLVWPLMWPNEILVFLSAVVMYWVGGNLMNRMLTSEFVRKTQLEADQVAARQIQRTLTPIKVDEVPGYEVETFYKPLRDVGGDYFDVIELGDKRTLFAIADVSGKGMPAALLAANIQALVRSNAGIRADPLVLTQQINSHLSRYTPTDRFATAVFIVLNRDTGGLTYVNAGHNAPLVFGSGTTRLLEATGLPLGLFPEATYTAETAFLPPGGTLLLFTDGLSDSISGEDAEGRLRHVLEDDSENTMQLLKSLVDPQFNEDDVTILLVKRNADVPSPSGASNRARDTYGPHQGLGSSAIRKL